MLALFLTSLVHANEPFDAIDIRKFRPSPDGNQFLGVPSASTMRHLQLGISVWGIYENDPLVLYTVASGSNGIQSLNERTAHPLVEVIGETGDAPIDNRFLGNVQATLGFFDRFSVAIDLPLVFWQSGYSLSTLQQPDVEPPYMYSSGIGDFYVQPKALLLDRDDHPVGLAVMLPISTPTGNGGSFLGEHGYSYTPMGVVEFSNGSIRAKEYMFRLAAYGGYHIRPIDDLYDIPIGNEAIFGVGVGFHPTQILELVFEYMGAATYTGSTAEINGGIKLHGGRHAALNLGAGTTIRSGIGAPDYRVVMSVVVAPDLDPNVRDPDEDGIPTSLDKCPGIKEDLDRFQDEDGCPDYDNDEDGYPDEEDQCPIEPEDFDNFQDEDGCADTDNDNDGIIDRFDRCPLTPETKNAYQDEDGCPDKPKSFGDTDGDGINDNVDECPFKPEDPDNFQDSDGCPEYDNDSDGVEDLYDKCPDRREVYNDVEDDDGCPDESMRVQVQKDSIRIADKIFFDFGLATIKEESFGLLDELSSVILAYPEISLIRIEGHTDNIGEVQKNLTLSQERAEAVRLALIERGVEEERLESMGYGESKPVQTNDTEAGREKNRRVEFIIVERE
ncbi:MAG: hypothetical protein CMK59_01595 [Proteobacteria bacterium]|nr:hypothetical protein [Pseudomonadota bacterium]